MVTSIKLTVFFEVPFWVGVFEKTGRDTYQFSKVVFGTEPKDYEIYDFVLKNYNGLKFSNSILINGASERKPVNPKRLQREIKKETENRGLGTKAQLAMKLQHEENKLERKAVSKEEKEMAKLRKFQLRQEKKLQKHLGH